MTTPYTEQELEQDLRDTSRLAVKRLGEALDDPGTQSETKARLALGVLGKHNSLYSGRNKRAEVLLSMAKTVRATGEAMASVVRTIAPQLPALAQAAIERSDAAATAGTARELASRGGSRRSGRKDAVDAAAGA